MRAWMCMVVLAGCGHHDAQPKAKPKTADELKKDWGAKVQAKLDKVVAAAKAAEGADLGAPGDGKLALDFAYDDDKDHPNAIAVQSDDVLSATAPRPAP